MKLFNLILLLLVFASCTTHYPKIRKVLKIESILYETDPSLKPLIKSFEYEALLRGVIVDTSRLTMTFGDVRGGDDVDTVGYCITLRSGTKVVRLHKSSWGFMDLYEQEALVFHELGHCLLNQIAHCDIENSRGPISLMNTYVLNGNYYKENREELLDELFNPNRECVPNNGTPNEVNGEVRSLQIGNAKR